MNSFRRRTDGKLVDEFSIRNDFSGSLPAVLAVEILNELGYDPVLHSPQLIPGYGQYVAADGAQQLEDGNWYYKWKLMDIDPETLAQSRLAAQEQIWEAIKAERDRRELQGGTCVDGKWFHSDEGSKIKQIALTMLGANIPSNLEWKMMNGKFTIMTSALALSVFITAVQTATAVFKQAEVHRQAMLLETNPADYNWMVGWPPAFEDTGAEFSPP